jgi:hypothetical protein
MSPCLDTNFVVKVAQSSTRTVPPVSASYTCWPRSQALYYDFLVASPLGADGLPPDDAQPSEQAPSPGQRSASSSGPTSHSQQLSLSPEERDLLRWARNASGLNPPPGTDTLSYKKATAVEALVGAWRKMGSWVGLQHCHTGIVVIWCTTGCH